MTSDWARVLDKRPVDRCEPDIQVIFQKLLSDEGFGNYRPMFLHQLCCYGFFEELDRDVTLFRQGDIGDNWYTVLSGTLNVYATQPSDSLSAAEETASLCTLGVGTSFGESVLTNTPHAATVITNEHCELLRIKRKDFQTLWEKNQQLVEDIIAPISTLKSLSGAAQEDSRLSNGHTKSLSSSERKDSLLPNGEKLALSLLPEPSPELSKAGWVLRTLILCQSPHLIRDRRYHSDPARQLRTFRKCLVGSELVDFVLELGIPQMRVPNRNLAIGMWQVLLEEGVMYHVTHEHQFKDKYLFYRFREDDKEMPQPTPEDLQLAEDDLQDVLSMMFTRAPAAIFRMILRKPHCERTAEDQEIIYEELLKIKAVSHLSNSVKRELTGVLVFESHLQAGTLIFNQGEEGHSWYIISKGSVNVVIYGKGTVCSLFAGDDFGKLALLNDAPRAATIITNENNCVFLRVEKDDFNRILRDVEATLVRLKEHGQDVLLLQKVVPEEPHPEGSHNDKYTVMAGTPQKMLEHLLESCVDRYPDGDTFLEDFSYSHVIFMPTHQLCPELMRFFRIRTKNNEAETEVKSESEPVEQTEADIEFITANKKRIVRYVQLWASLIHAAFYDDETIESFLQELLNALIDDYSQQGLNLQDEIEIVTQIIEDQKKFKEEVMAVIQRWKVGPYGHVRLLSSEGSKEEEGGDFPTNIKSNDEIVFRVYCEDQTYTTIKALVGASAGTIKGIVAEKLGLKGELTLLEVKSTGERQIFKDTDTCIPTQVTVNGRLFLVPTPCAEGTRPLPEQEGPSEGCGVFLEGVSAAEIAYAMTMYEWEIFTSIHEYELIYQVFGRSQYRRTTGNLDVFVRRFNEVQYWVGTEVTLASTPAKRAALLRKFIKVASYCREYKNMNSFFAMVMGLGNAYVSRLNQTWEKVPSKLRRTFADFEALIDPSRNYRKLRLYVAKMEPPLIPLMPLLLKDMTFSHEGNKTYMEGLLNFEKMHMIAHTLRTIRRSKSQPLALEPPSDSKNAQEVRNYVRNLRVIDNEKHLTKLSETVEPRRQQ